MSLNPESKYPTRRAYVVKVRGDANPNALAGRLENLVTGAQREFTSGGELLESHWPRYVRSSKGRVQRNGPAATSCQRTVAVPSGFDKFAADLDLRGRGSWVRGANGQAADQWGGLRRQFGLTAGEPASTRANAV